MKLGEQPKVDVDVIPRARSGSIGRSASAATRAAAL
jgi:hypothetical protein